MRDGDEHARKLTRRDFMTTAATGTAALYLTASLAAGMASGRPALAQTIDQQHIQLMQQQLRELQRELQALKRQQAAH